jgi:hypothetical protein
MAAGGGVLVGERELQWQARRYGRPYDLPPLIVHGPDQCSWVGPQVGGVKSWGLIGAAVPRGAAGPTQLPCDALTVLRDVQDHSLMAVVAVKCGSIDPSASNRSFLIKPIIHRCISSIQGVFVGLLVPWTLEEDFGWCGRTSLVRPDLGGATRPTFVVSGPWTWSPYILC